MYEHRHHKPISTHRFLLRLLQHAGMVLLTVSVSLAVGMVGFHSLENMPWLDSFLNAAMLLGGMGPVKTTGLSEAGKLFAGLYALYAGLVFIALTGIMLAPVAHRVLHRFHWEDK